MFVRALFIALIICSTAVAQTTLEGIITDAETGKPLPYVNIQLEGTYKGTITNDEGEFTIRIQALPATLIFSHIGYELEQSIINTPGRLDIRLKPTVIIMPPVVVSSEDPGMRIMRSVIKKKHEWRARLKSYKAEAYCRITFLNDEGIFLVRETLSDVYWDDERGICDVIRSLKQTADAGSDFMPSVGHLPNFYEDHVKVARSQMISVVHPDALKYYEFKLVGQRMTENGRLFEIAAKPKSRLQPLFVGKVFVLSEADAMVGIELETPDYMVQPMPVREAKYSYRQQFSCFGGDFWLPVSLVRHGRGIIQMPGLTVEMNFKDLYEVRDYAINIPLPDSLYLDEEAIQIDSVSVQSTVLHDDVVSVPLSTTEQRVYETTDSTFSFIRALKPRGFLSSLFIKAAETEENESKPESNGPRRIKMSVPRLWLNRAEGFHGALSAHIRLKDKLGLGLLVGYSTAGQLTWGVRLGLPALYAEIQQGSECMYAPSIYPHPLITAFSIFGREDYFDYYWQRGVRLTWKHDSQKFPLQWKMEARLEKHSAMTTVSDWSLFGSRGLRFNPAADVGRLHSISVNIIYGPSRELMGITGQKRFELIVEHSSPIIGSDFTFTRVDLDLLWRFDTFLRRRFHPMTLDIRLDAGMIRGDVPLQRLGGLNRSLGAFSVFGAFRSLRGRPHIGEKHAALSVEHNFSTVPFEILRLGGLAKRGVEVMIFGSMGRVWEDDNRVSVYPLEDEFIFEVGISINKLFYALRLDVTKRLDRNDYFLSISLPRFY